MDTKTVDNYCLIDEFCREIEKTMKNIVYRRKVSGRQGKEVLLYLTVKLLPS
jgi:hypothetical protein